MGADLYNEITKNNLSSSFMSKESGVFLLEVRDRVLPFISMLAHEKLNICSGYVVEDDELMGRLSLKNLFKVTSAPTFPEVSFKQDLAQSIKQVDELEVKRTIESLSSFRNRYYKSETGVQSQEWLHDRWSELSSSLSNAEVSYFFHDDFNQPSVIMTFHGTDLEKEILVIGGHGDSISGWFPLPSMHAPGADDNASGIATLTEVIRVLSENNFAPKRTVQFISYAAEEVGLKGSHDIAQKYAQEQKDVKGVLQFDMTNFKNSPYDFVFINDYTTNSLSEYLIELLGEYLPEYNWAYDKCGYACSDHVSWYREGYPVAFPFETTFASHNDHIHSEEDTIAISDNSAEHAAKFSKLALAFVLEMSNPE